ncbi:RlpA-like double-psi beta-barrel domain-containing protein [Diplocloster modestus]|uniref:Uncharacterized protein n=1 Tax=Diplocloster modestus TaxID=2850322 RepID=A0ABS6KAF8_9FIRM|nr:hypothetical protein [Diplocloster modestus]MBU9727482.1 hypothetical protein [Diplocloster modestus]
MKKSIGLLLVCILVISNFSLVFASSRQNPESLNQELNSFDIKGLSKKYNVDENELREAVKNALNSDVFSPFSDIEIPGTNQSSDVIIPNGVQRRGDFSVINQDVTAYTAERGRKTASGVYPYVGNVACHRYDDKSPYIPYGSTVTYPESIKIGSSSRRSFTVDDTGTGGSRSYWWTDVYFGYKPDMDSPALNFGVKHWAYDISTP